jgi:hypothetical protein
MATLRHNRQVKTHHNLIDQRRYFIVSLPSCKIFPTEKNHLVACAGRISSGIHLDSDSPVIVRAGFSHHLGLHCWREALASHPDACGIPPG